MNGPLHPEHHRKLNLFFKKRFLQNSLSKVAKLCFSNIFRETATRAYNYGYNTEDDTRVKISLEER